MAGTADSAFPHPGHRHDRCIASGMAEAEKRADAEGQRLTPQRRQVLEILLADHKPLGAYDILERMAAEGGETVRRPAPPVVYRALEFLTSLGLVHRISRLNAFTACDLRQGCRGDAFLICEDCGRVAEIEDVELRTSLATAAGSNGFSMSSATVELLGRCPDCQHRTAA
jgi:Fur family transcriptional regulator, zinc uptake regulator